MAAVTVPLDRPGIGWLITGLAVAGGLTTVVVQHTRSAPDAASASPDVASASPGSPPGAGEPAKSPDAATIPNAGPTASTPAGPTVGTAVPAEDAAPLDRPAASPASRAAGWPVTASWGALALALLSVGTFRAAGWLFALCVLGAFVAATVAVGRGRTTIGLLLSVVTPPAAAVRGVVWLARGIRLPGRAPAPRPAAPGAAGPAGPTVAGPAGPGRAGPGRAVAPSAGRGRADSSIRLLRTIAAACLGLFLVLIFGALFASADPAFARLIDVALPDISAGTVIQWIFLFLVVGTLTLGGAFLLVNPTNLGSYATPGTRPVRRIEWALPVGLVIVVFALFVGVQLTVLFGDRDYVMRTADLTFAEYARRGFGQLLVVTLLSLLVFSLAAWKAPRAGLSDRVLLRVLLGLLGVCVLVVVASAVRRMWVYEEAYGFTRLRVVVSAFELWLGALFVLGLVAGIRLRAAWLPRAVLATGLVALLGLAVANPDRFIAAQNVARYEDSGRIDAWYLRRLSADAAPELVNLPEEVRICALGRVADELRSDPDHWWEYNLGRATARASDLPDEVDTLPSSCYWPENP